MAKMSRSPTPTSTAPNAKRASSPSGRAPHRHVRDDDGAAFMPDPIEEGARLSDDEAEAFAEEFIASATSGESVEEEAADEVVDEENGGPFVEYVLTMPGEGEEEEHELDAVVVHAPREGRRRFVP